MAKATVNAAADWAVDTFTLGFVDTSKFDLMDVTDADHENGYGTMEMSARFVVEVGTTFLPGGAVVKVINFADNVRDAKDAAVALNGVFVNAVGGQGQGGGAFNPANVAGLATTFVAVVVGIKQKQRLNPPGKTRVTSWAEKGIVPDLKPNRWVMIGGPTLWNYLKTGLVGGKLSLSKTFPWIAWKRSNAPFKNYISDFVDTSKLVWPNGAPFIKGLLGQRRIRP